MSSKNKFFYERELHTRMSLALDNPPDGTAWSIFV